MGKPSTSRAPPASALSTATLKRIGHLVTPAAAVARQEVAAVSAARKTGTQSARPREGADAVHLGLASYGASTTALCRLFVSLAACGRTTSVR